MSSRKPNYNNDEDSSCVKQSDSASWGDEVTLSKRQRSHLRNLVNAGWDRDTALLKLRIYKFNLSKTKKHKSRDSFCHQFAIYGYCAQSSRDIHVSACSNGEHAYNIDDLINHKNDVFATHLCEYLLSMHHFQHSIRLHRFYAELMANKLNPYHNFDVACEYFERVLKMKDDRKLMQKYASFLIENNIDLKRGNALRLRSKRAHSGTQGTQGNQGNQGTQSTLGTHGTHGMHGNSWRASTNKLTDRTSAGGGTVAGIDKHGAKSVKIVAKKIKCSRYSKIGQISKKIDKQDKTCKRDNTSQNAAAAPAPVPAPSGTCLKTRAWIKKTPSEADHKGLTMAQRMKLLDKQKQLSLDTKIECEKTDKLDETQCERKTADANVSEENLGNGVIGSKTCKTRRKRRHRAKPATVKLEESKTGLEFDWTNYQTAASADEESHQIEPKCEEKTKISDNEAHEEIANVAAEETECKASKEDATQEGTKIVVKNEENDGKESIASEAAVLSITSMSRLRANDWNPPKSSVPAEDVVALETKAYIDSVESQARKQQLHGVSELFEDVYKKLLQLRDGVSALRHTCQTSRDNAILEQLKHLSAQFPVAEVALELHGYERNSSNEPMEATVSHHSSSNHNYVESTVVGKDTTPTSSANDVAPQNVDILDNINIDAIDAIGAIDVMCGGRVEMRENDPNFVNNPNIPSYANYPNYAIEGSGLETQGLEPKLEQLAAGMGDIDALDVLEGMSDVGVISVGSDVISCGHSDSVNVSNNVFDDFDDELESLLQLELAQTDLSPVGSVGIVGAVGAFGAVGAASEGEQGRTRGNGGGEQTIALTQENLKMLDRMRDEVVQDNLDRLTKDLNMYRKEAQNVSYAYVRAALPALPAPPAQHAQSVHPAHCSQRPVALGAPKSAVPAVRAVPAMPAVRGVPQVSAAPGMSYFDAYQRVGGMNASLSGLTRGRTVVTPARVVIQDGGMGMLANGANGAIGLERKYLFGGSVI